jgi:hypothetical protein
MPEYVGRPWLELDQMMMAPQPANVAKSPIGIVVIALPALVDT